MNKDGLKELINYYKTFVIIFSGALLALLGYVAPQYEVLLTQVKESNETFISLSFLLCFILVFIIGKLHISVLKLIKILGEKE